MACSGSTGEKRCHTDTVCLFILVFIFLLNFYILSFLNVCTFSPIMINLGSQLKQYFRLTFSDDSILQHWDDSVTCSFED